jgi:hypothetical protein
MLGQTVVEKIVFRATGKSGLKHSRRNDEAQRAGPAGRPQ